MEIILEREKLSEKEILYIFEKIDFLFPVLRESFDLYKKLFLKLKEYTNVSKKVSYRISMFGSMLKEIEKEKQGNKLK